MSNVGPGYCLRAGIFLIGNGVTIMVGVSLAAEMTSNDSDIPQELRRLKDADPAADVAAAIRAGDLRFLAVRGFVVKIPGIPKGPKRGWLLMRHGSREIEGTGDFRMVPDLQEAAERYAERYNRLLLEHLERR